MGKSLEQGVPQKSFLQSHLHLNWYKGCSWRESKANEERTGHSLANKSLAESQVPHGLHEQSAYDLERARSQAACEIDGLAQVLHGVTEDCSQLQDLPICKDPKGYLLPVEISFWKAGRSESCNETCPKEVARNEPVGCLPPVEEKCI